jgi:hypothetical protein
VSARDTGEKIFNWEGVKQNDVAATAHAPAWFLFEVPSVKLKLIQTQMAQKPLLRSEVYARALRASQNVKRAAVWVGAR